MKILIIESEPLKLLEKTGQSHARDFGMELQRINSSIDIDLAAPYDRPFDQSILSSVNAVVFPGSGVSWSAHDAEAAPLRAAMEVVFEAGLPCFGSCNGLQLAGVILGGQIESSDPELGIAREINLTEAGLTHPMMTGREHVFSAPTIHGDQVVELPGGAQLLASNNHCRIQSFVYDFDGIDFWGVEYHPEISAVNIGKYMQGNLQKFPNTQDVIKDLLVAETNSAAAARLGTSIGDMSSQTRTTELRNWLRHVEPGIETENNKLLDSARNFPRYC